MAACHFSSIQNNRNLIALFYIRCTGNDLDHFRTDIDLTDDQLIRIRVFFDLLNLANYDFL